MKVSVVVPFYNAERTLAECLEALADQDYAEYEVILVDNNSTDLSPAIAREFLETHPDFEAQLVREQRQGVSIARNTGARLATGEIIANTDSDCLPTRSWLSELVEAFADEEIAAVAGNIDTRRPENIYELFSALFTLQSREREAKYQEYTLTQGGCAAANLAVRRNWFVDLEGFDESAHYRGRGLSDDQDFLARLNQRGGTLWAITGATVLHWHRSSFFSMVHQVYLYGLIHAIVTRQYGKQGILITVWGREFFVPWPVKGWIDFDALDKKIALLLVAGVLDPAAFVLLALYLIVQVAKMKRRVWSKGSETSWGKSAVLLVLLLVKSGAITCGRLWGSLLKRVVCI